MDWVSLFADLLLTTKLLVFVIGVIFLVSGLDDLFIDVVYALRVLYRRWYVKRRYATLSEESLVDRPEQPLAVMIPAWDESAVIQPMLRRIVQRTEYSNYDIFVGTYPNDEATVREVEAVRQDAPRVHRVSLPHDGPTNKADCLNWLYQGIRAHEKQHQRRYEIFVMQDCEDVVHPLCYKIFNYLIARIDMIQLPVLSLERRWWNFTAGHYLDEFAQVHYKDLVVRELLNRSVPAAGVGCAFSRRALERVAAERDNELFNTGSLTEDYDIGFRLKDLGLRQAFVKFFVERPVVERRWWGGRARTVMQRELVAVREYFPHTLRAAVRQKGRWVLGIALQGWANLGWRGGVGMRYMLWRDRKALLTNLVNVLGYLVVLIIALQWAILSIEPDAWRYPALIEPGDALYGLVAVNAVLFGYRLIQRAYCVGRLYGPAQAALSVPRAVWGNVINFLATGRALRLFALSKFTGKRIAWDKTQHAYPSEAELQQRPLRLGELLLEERLISAEQLGRALQEQSARPRLLGVILQDMGLVQSEQIAALLGRQRHAWADAAAG